jgi:hypothetical protein
VELKSDPSFFVDFLFGSGDLLFRPSLRYQRIRLPDDPGGHLPGVVPVEFLLLRFSQWIHGLAFLKVGQLSYSAPDFFHGCGLSGRSASGGGLFHPGVAESAQQDAQSGVFL